MDKTAYENLYKERKEQILNSVDELKIEGTAFYVSVDGNDGKKS